MKIIGRRSIGLCSNRLLSIARIIVIILFVIDIMVKSRVLLEPAFVLHRRAYRNSSWLVELLTVNEGRVSALAHGARGLRSPYRGKLELFFPLLISWTGKRDLKVLTQVELKG